MKQTHVIDDISIYYDTETNEYPYKPELIVFYDLQPELINGRKYYKRDDYVILFCN